MSVLKSVEDYIKLGFRPVPIFGMDGSTCLCGEPCKERDRGKHTLEWVEEDYKKGCRFKVSDFSEYHNVALACGPQDWPDSDWLVVLDADGPFDWNQLGDLPKTMTAKSPRGEHRYFRVKEREPLGNWTNVFQVAEGKLDIRYARGRIMCAPSKNYFGDYIWDDFSEPVRLVDSALQVIYQSRKNRGLPVASKWDRPGCEV